MKTCTVCKKNKPFSSFYYHKNKSAPNKKRSYSGPCKICYRRRKRNEHRENKFVYYQERAAKKWMLFEITKEEFTNIQKQACIYCGKKPAMGLDRKDNSAGYIIRNVLPCCKRCNRGKFKGTAKAFINHCFKVVKYTERSNNGRFTDGKK